MAKRPDFKNNQLLAAPPADRLLPVKTGQ